MEFNTINQQTQKHKKKHQKVAYSPSTQQTPRHRNHPYQNRTFCTHTFISYQQRAPTNMQHMQSNANH